MGLHNRKVSTIALTFLLCALLAGFSNQVYGETYALTLSTPRTQEVDSPGVTMSLDVTGATVGVTYSFVWLVSDPNGTDSSTSSMMPNAPSSFVLSVNYPVDFGGAHIEYVGRYVVNVFQTDPVFALVGSDRFDAGLTDKASYLRMELVSIKASGYEGNENVTIDLKLSGGSAQGFPHSILADPNGNVVDSWPTLPSTPTGNYTVTLTGAATPPKSPPDRQSFLLFQTNVTIAQISVQSSSFQRTETVEFNFQANYPNGDPVQTGPATVRIAEPDQTSHYVTATWNETRNRFLATYRLPLNGQAGTWVATIDVGSFDDGFGNSGPLVSPLRGFTVNPASLMVSVTTPNGTLGIGDIVLIRASITSPDGSGFTSGTIMAEFTLGGRPLGSSALSYDSAQGLWVGSHIVREDDGPGAWLIQVSASDSYGNNGLGYSTVVVNVQRSQSPLTSWWFLALMSGLTIAGLLVVFLKRKKFLRPEIKVDLQAVGREAASVKNQEFFRSVQRQLLRMKQAQEADKNG